jgi:hypothetical protein
LDPLYIFIEERQHFRIPLQHENQNVELPQCMALPILLKCSFPYLQFAKELFKALIIIANCIRVFNLKMHLWGMV